MLYLFAGATAVTPTFETFVDEVGDVDSTSLPGYSAWPGTARIISQRLGSLLNRVVRVLEFKRKTD